MKLGSTEPIVIEDVTFHVLRKRGPRRRWVETIIELNKNGGMDSEGFSEGFANSYITLLSEAVVSVEGLLDENEQPIVWNSDPDFIRALVDELPADVIDKLTEILTTTVKATAERGNASGG